MKKSIPFLLAVLLAACGPSEAPKQANVPTVEELAADPARLKELRQQCKIDRATLGEVLCNRVAEATQTILWRWNNALHTTGNTTEVLITSPSQKNCSSLPTRRSAPAPAAFLWVLHSLKRCFFIILLPITVFDRH